MTYPSIWENKCKLNTYYTVEDRHFKGNYNIKERVAILYWLLFVTLLWARVRLLANGIRHLGSKEICPQITHKLTICKTPYLILWYIIKERWHLSKAVIQSWAILPPRGHLATSRETFSVVTTWRVLQTSREEGPGVLLNTLQWTGQYPPKPPTPPQQRNI